MTILQNNSATTQPVLLSSLILDRPALWLETLTVNMGKSAAVGNVIQGHQKPLCFLLLIYTLSTLFDLNVCRSALWWDATMVPGLGTTPTHVDGLIAEIPQVRYCKEKSLGRTFIICGNTTTFSIERHEVPCWTNLFHVGISFCTFQPALVCVEQSSTLSVAPTATRTATSASFKL